MKKLLFATSTCFLTFLSSTPVHALIFWNTGRWNPEKDKTSLIQVCLQPGSSVNQRSSNWWQYGLIHAPNPSLEEVVVRITRALESSWGRKGSITFVGWKACDQISQQERNNSINFWISPDADNQSYTGIDVRGRDKGTKIKPWGNGGSPTLCINYNWGHARMEYSFDCAEQYAIHEFGHALGFEHEWNHPNRPSTCTPENDNNKISWSDASTTYPNFLTHTIPNSVMDFDSIMTYGDRCVEQTGVRFGSTSLSSTDESALDSIYQEPKFKMPYEGIYTITTGGSVGSAWRMNMEKASAGWGTRAITSYNSGSIGKSEEFTLLYNVEQKAYEIRPRIESNRDACLQVNDNGQLELWKCNQNSSQYFLIECTNKNPLNDGYSLSGCYIASQKINRPLGTSWGESNNPINANNSYAPSNARWWNLEQRRGEWNWLP